MHVILTYLFHYSQSLLSPMLTFIYLENETEVFVKKWNSELVDAGNNQIYNCDICCEKISNMIIWNYVHSFHYIQVIMMLFIQPNIWAGI